MEGHAGWLAWVFLATLISVTVVAVFAVTAGYVPGWVPMVLAALSLALPTALGLWQATLSRKQVELTRRSYELQRRGEPKDTIVDRHIDKASAVATPEPGSRGAVATSKSASEVRNTETADSNRIGTQVEPGTSPKSPVPASGRTDERT